MSEALQARRMAMLAEAGCTREEALAFIREVAYRLCQPVIEMPAPKQANKEPAIVYREAT